jgi:hypothetical protein
MRNTGPNAIPISGQTQPAGSTATSTQTSLGTHQQPSPGAASSAQQPGGNGGGEPSPGDLPAELREFQVRCLQIVDEY